jgi:hypothetical protein
MAGEHIDGIREWDLEALKQAVERRPPTPDDVSITWDGRRLDSRDAVLDFLDEINRERAQREGGVTA